MLKKILGVVAALVLVFVAVVATRPGEFTVERSAVVDAPADVVFARVDGFKSWDLWAPWSKLDLAMTKTLTGPETGKGAHYEWKGNDKVGSGNMTVTESTPPSKVVMDLNFTEPFEAGNVSTFNITPDGDKSKVSWVMTGKNNFMSKAAGLFMDMDKMIGADFEKGLADLKALAEKDAAEKKAAEKAAAEKATADAAAAAAAATVTTTTTTTTDAPQ